MQIELADQQKSEEAEFIMLKDGGIIFDGPAGELKRSSDAYLKTFLSGWGRPPARVPA